jgi:hypothetical protein
MIADPSRPPSIVVYATPSTVITVFTELAM